MLLTAVKIADGCYQHPKVSFITFVTLSEYICLSIIILLQTGCAKVHSHGPTMTAAKL